MSSCVPVYSSLASNLITPPPSQNVFLQSSLKNVTDVACSPLDNSLWLGWPILYFKCFPHKTKCTQLKTALKKDNNMTKSSMSLTLKHSLDSGGVYAFSSFPCEEVVVLLPLVFNLMFFVCFVLFSFDLVGQHEHFYTKYFIMIMSPYYPLCWNISHSFSSCWM